MVYRNRCCTSLESAGCRIGDGWVGGLAVSKPFWAVTLDHRGNGTRLIAVRESLQPGGKGRVPRVQSLHVVGPITDRAHVAGESESPQHLHLIGRRRYD